MLGRVLIGAGSLALYGWRVHDPKGSYAAFFDASDWITSWVISAEGASGYLKSFVNIILVDQADGFLLGMAFFALISIVFWPVKKCGEMCARGMGRMIGRGRPDDDVDERREDREARFSDNTRARHLPRRSGQPRIVP